MRPLLSILAATALGVALTACTPYAGGETVNGHRALERVPDEAHVPSDAEIAEAEQRSWEEATSQEWSCWYDPTINENWHDDVFCTNGPTNHRPTLLPGQFVTEADMRAAGSEYEAYLNSGGTPTN